MGGGLGSSFVRGTAAFGPWITADNPYDHQLRDQTMISAPTFPPFKFEPRRARIDWRLLHGIDINSMIRDVDLDTLEKIVNIVAFGDIEAEDTRHLTELNFIKIFRLSQMMIEYLLYVQDCLQSSNAWLQQDRSNMDKYVQAARLRIRELEANLKMNKRELRRARKTIKTYELLAVLNDGKATQSATMPAATAAVAATMVPQPVPPVQPTQVIKVEPNPLSPAVEALMRRELESLSERLNRATMECQTLRGEREDLYQAVKDLEALVKARSHMSGASSPQAHARQNAEAMQTIQGLQDQLSRTTAEITKLRNEKGDLVEELERANAERRQLQDEKGRLLSEIASRPSYANPASLRQADSAAANDNLGSMLLDAERQKGELQEQLNIAQAKIATLEKELVKAMKATAFGPLGAMPQPQAPDDRVVRELEQAKAYLEQAKAQLERELLDTRRTYTEDVRQLQEDLEMMQAKAVEADRRVAELRAELAAVSAQSQGSQRAGAPASGGFMKVMEQPRGGGDDYMDAESRRRQELLAEYEATNDRLNHQLAQLRGERNELASEVERLRLQLQAQPSPPRGDPSIGRDWRTEEIERLRSECDGAHRRIHQLEEALQDRDALVERLRVTIRDLQAQLEERSRQQQEAEMAFGRVKQQVQQFERMAGHGQHVKTSSFSFVPEEGQPASGSHAADTPTSVRKPPLPDMPPRSPSPRPSSPPPQPSVPINPSSPEFAPPSPQHPQQPLDPTMQSTWLRRIPRPSPEEAHAIHQRVLTRVAGIKPESLDMMLADEIRAITENPYEYEDDDYEVFRSIMPHDLRQRPGVLSVQPCDLEDLETARSLLTDQLLAVLDDQMAQYGIDASVDAISDKVYAASMKELNDRRASVLSGFPREVQVRADRLREALLTHVELQKRHMQKQQVLEQQVRLQEQQLRQGADAGGSAAAAAPEIEPAGGTRGSNSAAASGWDVKAEGAGTDLTAAPAAPASVHAMPPSIARTSAAPASGPPSTTISREEAAPAVVDVLDRPTASAGSAPGTSQPQLPAFPPPRQPSLPRSAAGSSSNGSIEDISDAPPPAAAGTRPVSETSQVAPSRSSIPSRGREPPLSSTRASPQSTPLDRSFTRETSLSDRQVPQDTSARSSRNSSLRSGHGQQSAARSVASSRPGPEPTTASQPTPTQPVTLQLLKEEPQHVPERIVLGHAKPTSAAAQPPSPAAAAPTPGGNMNMSIRSVKYQESDFDDDDDDDVLPSLPRPKAVARMAVDDEYGLTEDEETQQDMGIEDDDDDISPMGRKHTIFMRTGSPSRAPPAPSTQGVQRAQPVTASRGWATDEPLQPAAPPPAPAQKRTTETAEIEEIESIHSFGNTSQSMSRPGAWGSPAATMRKVSTSQQAPREPSTQLSGTSKQSNWDELKSFGASSTPGEEPIQELTAMDSFTDTVRPMSRPAPVRGAFGAPQAGGAFGASTASRPVAKRASFSSDVSDMEFA